MRLSRVKLAGFKSFVDPTTVHFPGNLTGIVGPNGCGKSNVIDAVRWVMGESSAKTLRGESMADVIFNGSNARKPVGHATIELVFDNSDGSLGGKYAGFGEISIRRQLSRDGQSHYYLNGARCRRRDITDILLGTGLGSRSYSIIEQGMISRLIEARPEDLRLYLEEVAGISKYKERRRETENRIRHTRDNLDRLGDLREELEKQLAHLQRQSKAAERYKELKEEERRVKADLLALRHRELDTEAEARQRAMAERETAVQAVVAGQRAAETAGEKARQTLIEANDAFNAVQGRYYSVGAEIARIEQTIQHARDTRQRQQQEQQETEQAFGELQQHIENDERRLREIAGELAQLEPDLAQVREREQQSSAARSEAEQAMQDWQAEWDDFNQRAAEVAQVAQVERTRIDALDRHLLQLVQRLERIALEQRNLSPEQLQQEIDALAQEAQTHEQTTNRLQAELNAELERIQALRKQIDERNAKLDELRGEQQDVRGRLASLEALQQAALGQREGAVTHWLQAQGLEQAPRLAQKLNVDDGWERAVETVLGFYLEAVCVDGIDQAAAVLDGLDHGSLALFDTSADSRGTHHDGMRLSDRVQSPWPLDSLLGGVYAADSLADALRMRARLAANESVITPEGIWIGARWLRVARDADEKVGVLGREREIADLHQSLEAAGAAVERAQQELEATRAELQAAEQRRGEKQEEVNQAHRQGGEVRARSAARRAQLEQIEQRAAGHAREAEELVQQQAREDEELRGARTRLQGSLTQLEQLADERAQREAARSQLRQVLDEARTRAAADRDAAHEAALRAGSLRTARDTTTENLERMRSQQQHLRERRESLSRQLGEIEAPLAAFTAELEGVLAQRLVVEEELSGARSRTEEIDAQLREIDSQRSAREREAEETRAQLQDERMAWQEINVRRQTVLEQIAESGFELATLVQELPEDATADKWQELADQLAQRIQRLGPINLAAIDEYEESSKRKVYLDAQFKDLNDALETLESAIRKIDRETRDRFKDTFERVNTNLQAMFPRLFGGGHAYLELTGEDLLDTGVTVMARPPGKRNSSIHLLSGGEKALTAVALVFSLFELNPAPFCMLDEVDAPLDDTNVSRFCDLVREMSERVQFIFITHNKITMEMSHQLTGVTMSEPGVSRLVAVDLDEAVQLAAM